EVALLLVETRVHVVADLEPRRTAVAHAVVLAVVLGEQHGTDRLALAVAQRQTEIRSVESEVFHVLRRLRRDAGAAQVAQVVDEALDGAGLRRLLALDLPASRLAVRQGGARTLLALDHDAADTVGAEAEHRLVTELPGVLAERAQRPVAERDDRGLVAALREDLLLRALRAVVADQQRLGSGALVERNRHREAWLVEAGRAAV